MQSFQLTLQLFSDLMSCNSLVTRLLEAVIPLIHLCIFFPLCINYQCICFPGPLFTPQRFKNMLEMKTTLDWEGAPIGRVSVFEAVSWHRMASRHSPDPPGPHGPSAPSLAARPPQSVPSEPRALRRPRPCAGHGNKGFQRIPRRTKTCQKQVIELKI